MLQWLIKKFAGLGINLTDTIYHSVMHKSTFLDQIDKALRSFTLHQNS